MAASLVGKRKVTCRSGAERMIPTNPVRFQSQGDPELRQISAQGSDTEAILAELGYSADEARSILDSRGAVATTPRM